MAGLAHPKRRFESGFRVLPGRMRRKQHLLSTIRDCDFPHPTILLAHSYREKAVALQGAEIVADRRSIHCHEVREAGHRHGAFRGEEAQQAILG